jgi:hypothetical protein
MSVGMSVNHTKTVLDVLLNKRFDKNCTLLGYYAANFLPKFQDNLTGLSPGFKNPKKACSPSTELIKGRVWAVKSFSSMVSANSVVASGWMEWSVVISVVTERCSMTEGILTGVTARHRRTLT